MSTKKAASALDRLIQQALGANGELGSRSDEVRETCPELWRWLSETEAGADHLKDPATLTIRLVAQGVMVSVGDKTFGVSCDAACATLGEVFRAIEQALTAPTPALRQWPNHQMVLRKKPKKEVTKA
jgi:hypothetical protein